MEGMIKGWKNGMEVGRMSGKRERKSREMRKVGSRTGKAGRIEGKERNNRKEGMNKRMKMGRS